MFRLGKNQKRWIEALRSGKYKKGNGTLKYGDSYCCLGVACEIFAGELGLKTKLNGVGVTLYDGESSYLPEKVAEFLGLRSTQGWAQYAPSLVNINDRRGADHKDFSTVADLIEESPKDYFKKEK